MQCILCLKTPNELINIFGENGLRYEIKDVIVKHFWMQPVEDDPCSNKICPLCWTSLESFHKFYEEIEGTHCLFMKIKPTDDIIEQIQIETINTNDGVLDDYNNILFQDIKVELKDETSEFQTPTEQSANFPIDVAVKPDEIDDDGDDSDDSNSKIPLSKLSKEPYLNKKVKHSKPKKETESTDEEESKVDEKFHIHNGIWLAKCFAEETTDRAISQQELDKFISLNMEIMCEVCRIPIKDFLTLQKHFKDNHIERTFVTCCDRKFTLRSRLVDHILLHKLPEYFKCVECAKVLCSRENLRKHMIVHDKKYNFQCEKCEKTFYRKQLLDRHMDTHITERKFKCDKCDKLFTSKFSLGQHIYGVHKGGYKKICEQCGKVTRDQEAFVRHKLEHTNQPRPYVECPQCGIKLIDKNGLRKHIQSKHPEEIREHTCIECGLVTNSIFALRRHISFMHKKTRDFKCAVCEKAFKRALTLKPKEEENSLICSPCWKSLQSFHTFYQKVEEAHRLFAQVISPNRHDDVDVTDSLTDDIKLEISDDLLNEQLELDENIKCPIKSKEQWVDDGEQIEEDDDSDSEIPLSKLTEQLLVDDKKGILEKIQSATESDSQKAEKTKDEIIHVRDGKWLATCFSEETVTKPISTDELDKFIKLNLQLTCEICHIPMDDFSNLQTHFKNNHPVKPFVTCCDKKFELRCRLVDHILLHKLPNYFTCVVCSRVLSCRLNLRKHMTIHDEKQILQCDKCEKTFARKEALNRHILDIHTLDRKFKCDECHKLFASKCSLNTHIYGVHKGRYKKICEQCGKVSCDQETFLRHKMKHSNEPQQYFQCPKCTVKLSSKHGLRHHVRYQHSEDKRKHVCNVCGTVANNESALKRHITFMHKYKRDFKCTLCDKAFKRALTLKPNSEDPDAKSICISCWNSLKAFHDFYESIEEAHFKLTACIKTPQTKNEHESNSDLLTTVVKEEYNVETCKIEMAESEDDVQEDESQDLSTSIKNENYQQSDSNDSFSSNNNDDNDQEEQNINSDSDYNTPKIKVKVKTPPCKEFDAFIKKHIKLSCSLCAKSVENFQCLKEHFLKVHKKKPYVTCCDKQWTSRLSLVHHLLLHEDPEFLKCKICGRMLASVGSKRKHMKSHLKNQERVHECTKCKKMFSTEARLEKHWGTHIRKLNNPGVCDQCGKVFQSKDSLKAHQKREHMNRVKQKAQCLTCGVYLSDKACLYTHMKNQHPKEKVVHTCEICGKISPTARALKRHNEYMHKMKRVHKCTICDDKAFKTLQMLKAECF